MTMNHDYDDDDYKLNDTTGSYHIDFDDEKVDLDDFDNLRSNLFEELESAISYAETKLQLAIGVGCRPEEIERLEDELTLLLMDYEKFEV